MVGKSFSFRLLPSLVILCLLHETLSYKIYEDMIPNGVRVPHPCKASNLWHGVGHMNSEGGGSRNVFGVAFEKAGHTWTRELCQADSDGDGKTNGEELGDPRCVWTRGSTPEKTSGLSHPGICEPLESEACQLKEVPPAPGNVYKYQRGWMADACKNGEFECEDLKNTADVRQMKIRIPPTRVPAKETTYMCAYVDFENVTTDFHVIANTPIINNSYVMHHMTLMGCPNGYEDPEQALHQPFECYMGSCVDILAVWTLGMNGQCFHRDAGFKVGANSYKRLRIEYHWNNPMRQSDFVDSSGFTLYYTPHLRRHNMGMLVVGQEYLEIPPFTDLTVASSDCTATCTKNLLKSDIYVTSAFNHMHYLGKSMLMEHHRGSQMLRYITKDLAYDYNTPVIHSFSDPLVIQPGDTIRTTCHFKSSDKSVTTFQGENTSDEMCYGFITYFPVESVPGKACLSPWKGYMDCDPSTQFGCSSQERKKFSGQQLNNTNLFRDITSVCKPVSKCTEECKSAIKAAMAREPCMQTQDGRDFVESLMLRHSTGRMLMDYLLPCQLSIYKDGQKDGEACTEAVVDETSGGETPEMTLILLAFLVPVSCLWSWS